MENRIRRYLNERGISDAVIEDNMIEWNGSEIVIPIFDKEPGSKVLFHKYRRDPQRTDGNKYRYDKGAFASLFCSHLLTPGSTVFLTEGELDALALQSYGFNAVSGTGGSGTFREDWIPKFENVTTYIIYDADEAGARGALNAQSFIPHAKIIWLPQEKGVKDITDYLQKHGLEKMPALIAGAESYNIPRPLTEIPTKKKDLAALVKQYKALIFLYNQKAQDLNYFRKDDVAYWCPIAVEMLQKQVQELQPRARYMGQRGSEATDRIKRAKEVPLTNYIGGFNYAGYRRCLWHDEKTGSLYHYHTENRLYCYAGCGHKDVIDVVMKVKNLSFKDAVKELLHE